MTEASATANDNPQRKGRSKSLLAVLTIAALAGGGGFYAVHSGRLDVPYLGELLGKGTSARGEAHGSADIAKHDADLLPDFVALEPLVISLGPQSKSRHLKVTLTVEVAEGRAAEVEAVKPRLIDVLNGFFRAVDERDFAAPRSMERLRAQMLRRVQLVSPPGAVQDLLIQEFVLN